MWLFSFPYIIGPRENSTPAELKARLDYTRIFFFQGAHEESK